MQSRPPPWCRKELQLARPGVAVEERPCPAGLGHRNDQPEMVLQRSGLVQPTDRDRIVAGVTDQLLGHLPGAVLGRYRLLGRIRCWSSWSYSTAS